MQNESKTQTATRMLLEAIADEALRRLSAEHPDGCMTLLTPELAEKTISLLTQATDDAVFTMSVSMTDEESLRGHVGEKVYMAADGQPVDLMQCDTLPMNFTLDLAEEAFEEGVRMMLHNLTGLCSRLLSVGVALKMANGCSADELLADFRRHSDEHEKK